MSGRNRRPRHADSIRVYREDPRLRPDLHRGRQPLSVHPTAMEEELAMQHRELQRVIAENRLVIDDNTILQRELTVAKDEIHRLGKVIPKLRAEKDAETRELIERGLKLEADIRAFEPIRTEVVQLRSEIQKLNALRQELSTQIQGLTQEVTHLQAENQQLVSMRSDMDGMRKELLETRRAYEFERKANEEQVAQKHAMEENLISMAREIEQLRAEQMNADRRALDIVFVKMDLQNSQPEKHPAVTNATSAAVATPASCRKKKNEQATFLEDVKDHIDEFINASTDEHASCFKKTIDKMFRMSKIVADKNAAETTKEVESSLPLGTTVAD